MLTPFYRRAEYRDVAGGSTRPPPMAPGVHLHGAAELRLNMLLSRFKATFPHYAGVLQGEYIAMPNGHTLIDVEGEMIVINCSTDDCAAAHDMNQAMYALDFQQRVVDTYRQWNDLPVAADTAILSHTFPDNYYHFCLDLLPQIRFLPRFQADTLAVPPVCLRRPVQRDLLARAQGRWRVAALESPCRVRDPILLHSFQSTAGLSWLRHAVALSPRPGGRRLYLQRTNVSRAGGGGGLAPTPELRGLLDEFGFETVDLGTGQFGIARQLAMLDGAGLILAAHGAALTNIAFMQPPLTVIELFGSRVYAGFADIAGQLGFGYHGVLCYDLDRNGDILAECGQLRTILLDALLDTQARAA